MGSSRQPVNVVVSRGNHMAAESREEKSVSVTMTRLWWPATADGVSTAGVPAAWAGSRRTGSARLLARVIQGGRWRRGRCDRGWARAGHHVDQTQGCAARTTRRHRLARRAGSDRRDIIVLSCGVPSSPSACVRSHNRPRACRRRHGRQGGEAGERDTDAMARRWSQTSRAPG